MTGKNYLIIKETFKLFLWVVISLPVLLSDLRHEEET